jgi:hypothetical protein
MWAYSEDSDERSQAGTAGRGPGWLGTRLVPDHVGLRGRLHDPGQDHRPEPFIAQNVESQPFIGISEDLPPDES